jgi:hypothetical protein
MTEETEQKQVFLRTLVKRELMDRLTKFSQQFTTGRGHWDLGVGIQVLLDFYDYNHQLATTQELSMKLDILAEHVMSKDNEPEKPKAEGKTELINGELA